MGQDFFKQYGFKILFVVVFLLAFIWMGTRRTIQGNSNSMNEWLPKRFQETKDYEWFLSHYPFESFIVVSWQGNTVDDHKLELFAQKLVPGQTIDNFSLMSLSTDLKATLDVEAVQDRLKPESDAAAESDKASFDDPSETEEKENDRPKSLKKAEPREKAPHYFKSVMTGPRLIRLLEQSYSKSQTGQASDALREKITQRLKGSLIGPDGKNTAMLVTLESGQKSGKELKQVLDEVRRISTECGIPDTRVIQSGSFFEKSVRGFQELIHELIYGREPNMNGVILGGPPVDNVALDQEGERTLFRLAGICALIGFVMAWLCLRSIRLVMFVFWIAILSAGLSMAAVSLTGGHCDSILLSMPALVYVLSMSGAIHMTNYYHDAIREHGLAGSCERAVRHAFTPCFLAQFTTAIGLGSLFLGGLTPIRNFGFYSAIGVMMSLILLFFYLPSLLYFYPSRKYAELYGGKGLESAHNGFFYRFWSVVGGFVIKYHTWVATVCFITMFIFAANLINLTNIFKGNIYRDVNPAFLTTQNPKKQFDLEKIYQIKFSVKLMDFFSPTADIIAHYTWLEEHLGPLVPMEIVVCIDNQELNPDTEFVISERLQLVENICQTLQKELADDIGGTLSAATMIPNFEMIREMSPNAPEVVIRSVLGKAVNDNRENLKDYITYEGNPTLDELKTFLNGKKSVLEKKTIQLQQTISAQGDDVNPGDSFEFKKISNELQVFSETLNLLNDEKTKTLFSQLKIVDLKTLVQAFSYGKAYAPLSIHDVKLLLDGAHLWQHDRGIELWRISLRIWSLKKDIDYSKFINNVKEVVEPILKEKSKELIALQLKSVSLERLSDQAVSNQEGQILSGQSAVEKEQNRQNPSEQTISSDSLSEKKEGNVLASGKAETRMKSMKYHEDDLVHDAGICAKYTGAVPIVYKTQHELISGLNSSLIGAFFLIALVMVFVLRSFGGAIVAMLPNLFPVICVFGFMGMAGITVDVGTMMTASVALGVAVDNTMHYLTWFSDGINKGKDVKEAALDAYKRCATAMTQSTLIGGLGLSAFMFSTFTPTQRFGALMLAILLVSLIGDLIFLPALLTGWGSKFFKPKRKRRHSDILESNTDVEQNQTDTAEQNSVSAAAE